MGAALKSSGVAAKKIPAKKAGEKTRVAKSGEASMTVGNVTVLVKPPSKAEIRRNIKSGQSAMKRGLKVIAKPGVTLEPRTTPIYYADPEHPGKIIRELNGEKVSGTFSINGRFVARR